MLAIFDYDLLTYKAGFSSEKRFVDVLHKPSGRKKIYKNKTEFVGRGKKIGGVLAGINEQRVEKGLEPFAEEEFEFETLREAEPIENALFTSKRMIEKVVERVGATNYIGYLGVGNGFRHTNAKLLEYKANRKGSLRPIHKDDIADYLVKHHNAIREEFYEADDRVIMKAIENGVDNSVVITSDKDSYGCPVRLFNPDRPEEGVVDCRGFGELTRVKRGNVNAVRGKGRKFFYWQVAHGDVTDNYKANCHSDEEWGEIGAYNALEHCKNDLECYKVLVGVFKHLYPEPVEIEDWEGNKSTINWLDVLNEMWDMARMRRWEGDEITAEEVLKKYGVI